MKEMLKNSILLGNWSWKTKFKEGIEIEYKN